MNALSPARWWSPRENDAVQCELCPRRCMIPVGKCGYCGVRKNHNGALQSLTYGYPVSVAIDPIEKKPLARFLPGSKTFSFGTFGCNLGCVFCQNDCLSRGRYLPGKRYDFITPAELVDAALRHNCPSISFTYNEPTVFAEYLLDIAKLAHEAGLKNVLVSNGYVSEVARQEIYPLMDAANIDMKGFSQEFYGSMCDARLAPVLESLQDLYRLGVHLEVTQLVIPGKNDTVEVVDEWLAWAKEKLDLSVPLHFSAYHPACECRIPPTPPATLYRIQKQAREMGFKDVFLGNI